MIVVLLEVLFGLLALLWSALISPSILINLSSLKESIMPIKLITSVILSTRLMQNNSNHLLGFRGMRTWLCVDATQGVLLVGV
jgi:hypothetical protein